IGLQTSQYIIFIFSFFFLLYSVGTFLKKRNKEFGLLLLLGISPRQMNKLIFIENMLIGMTAIVFGVFIGLILSKLILIIVANILGIYKGLVFYLPIKAMLLTISAFMLLFLTISVLTTKIVGIEQPIELLRSDKKPKVQPKSSKALSFLSITFILLGYFVEFYYTSHTNLFILIPMGVFLVVIGTYFLFSQFSIYTLNFLKRKENIYFKKVNLLTISELVYRMKDNAILFFMISIISAIAFTGIGTFMSLGNPGLSEMTNPFSYTYISSPENKQEEKHLLEINKKLKEAEFSYRTVTVAPKEMQNNLLVFSLTDFNHIATILGQPKETLKDENQTILVPTTVAELKKFKNKENINNTINLVQRDTDIHLRVKKTVPYLGWDGKDAGKRMIVVSDKMFKKIPLGQNEDTLWNYHLFTVKGWEKSEEITKQLENSFPIYEEGKYAFKALVVQWLVEKQENGMLIITSALVGILFFTFAASFLYSRLYTDLERDKHQYMSIAKIGLTKNELKKVITRQLCIMFFLPIVIALLHSIIAFIAIQKLVSFSIVMDSVFLLTFFLSLQVMYFFVVRWRYLRYLNKEIM
ncbi:FtsX-like permease family protein, partial [Lysinibacillus sp. NPDC056185]|uniref:FtsX-like permease family protein n=1 Tax=Lysinibacillus sp. NPDC056185 TaxID=3345739 RepID=UPI0039EE64E1